MQKKSRLSERSANLIWTLKATLSKYKIDVKVLIYKIFGEYKTSLKKHEFQKIIKFGDLNVTYSEIDNLYDEIRQYEGNILLSTIDRQLQIVKNPYSDSDYTNNKMNSNMFKGFKQLKQCLKNQGPYQIFQKFDKNKDGFLDVEQLNFLIIGCSNLLQDKQLRKQSLRLLLKDQKGNKISKNDFLKMFGLQNIPRRITLLPPPASIQTQDDKSIAQKYIQQSKIKYTQNQKSSISNNNSQKIEDIQPKSNYVKNADINLKSNVPKINPLYSNLSQNKPERSQKNRIFNDISRSKQSQSFKVQPYPPIKPNLSDALKYYRLQTQNIPFLQLLQQQLNLNQKFYDHQGPKSNKGQFVPAPSIFNTRFWLFQMANSILTREKQRTGLAQFLQPKDIIQGSLGDCYFLSSISSLVWNNPEHLSNLFMFDINPVGLYVVKLFNDGQWYHIVLDDLFPCTMSYSSMKPVYAKPHGKQIWVMLLEKAWAKLHVSYQNIDLGSSLEGLVALTGAPTKFYNKSDNIKNLILDGFKNGSILTCSGSDELNNLSQIQTKTLGLIPRHAYSILKLVQLNINSQKILLVRIRNPWGNQQWLGDWSFKSSKWTNDLRKKYNYEKNPLDGSFYMKWQDFEYYFGNITICYMIPNYVNSSIRISNVRHKSNYVNFTILRKGTYTFSIYQQSKRKYLNNTNYQLSQSRLIICKKVGSRYEYITSGNKHKSNLHIQSEFQPGEYILTAKVNWELFDHHECVLGSYGPDSVDFSENKNREVAVDFKRDLINTYVNKIRGQKTYYSPINVAQAYKQTLFDIDKGIGYILYKNPSSKRFKSTITLNKLKGIKVIKPNKLPLQSIIEGNSSLHIGFFISAQGYGYSMQQKMKLL